MIEIIGKIRKKVGNDFIVGVKLNCEDGDKNGITEEAFFKTCLMASQQEQGMLMN